MAVRRVADGTPVWAQPLPGSRVDTLAVHVADHALADKLRVDGVLFTVAAAARSSGSVQVGIDYSRFRTSTAAASVPGSAWCGCPACALTTPDLAACQTLPR